MKKLILLTCLLIFACSNGLFAQDYMEMRKKQLRIEYQKKIDLINTLTKNQDSLSSSNVKLESNLLTLKNYLKKINDSIVRLKSKNENLNSILIENEEKTSNLEREIYSLKDSISELKKIIEFNVNKSLDELRNSSNFETFLSYFIFSTCSEQNIDSLIASSSPLIMKFIDSNIQFGRFYNQGITCTLYNSSDYGYNDYYGDSFPKMSNISFYENKDPNGGFCEEASSPDGIYYKQIYDLPKDYDPIEIRDIPAPYYLRNLKKMEVNIQFNYYVVNTFYFVKYKNKWVLLYTYDCDCSS